MSIFENIHYLNNTQAPLMTPQATNSAESVNYLNNINLAASLIPGLFQNQPHQQQQQQQSLNGLPTQYQTSLDALSHNFGVNAQNIPLTQNTPANGISSMNQSALIQLEYLQQVQLLKQQQQQQDQQREQYKLALITELLKLEQQSQTSHIQQNQFSGLLGLGELNNNNNNNNIQGQFNQTQQQQQQQQPNTNNLLLELLLQQSKLGQSNQQATPSSFLSELPNQQNVLFQSQLPTASFSPKQGENCSESKTLSFIPSIASGSPQLQAQISPQLKKEDDSISAVQLNQQTTNLMRSAIECQKNNGSTSLSHMMDLQDIMNGQHAAQQNNEMNNQHDTNSLTKILTQSNFDNSHFMTNQQQVAKSQPQQQQISDGNSQNLDINIFLKQSNNEEFLEFQKKRQDRLIKIEKYKNKRRNWLRKISYDCRKKVADSRLRIKGRFISKKDTEKIKELIGDNQEAFNAKKNLRLDFMNSKMRLQNLDLNPAISKNEILCQIEKLLLKNRQIHTTQTMQHIVKRIQKRQQVFCLIKRGQTEMVSRRCAAAANPSASMQFSEQNEESSSIGENSKNSGFQN